MSSLKDAYFSVIAAKQCGYCLYKDQDGKTVCVTEIVDIGREPGSLHGDLRYVGVVTTFVTRIRDSDYLCR